jgi:hypothetical protein
LLSAGVLLTQTGNAWAGGTCALDTNGDGIVDGVFGAPGTVTSLACGTLSDASGGGNTAVGVGAIASGSSINTAVGLAAHAEGNGSENVATGANSDARGDNSRNVAIGSEADASGDGTENTAVGAGATATQTNSAAFGAGATATRANQQVFGTTSNTYTMGGITSAASKTAQTGAKELVTTDADGNLASDGGALQSQVDGNTADIATNSANIAINTTNISANTATIATHTTDIANLQTQADSADLAISSLQGDVAHLEDRDRELAEGIAISLALDAPVLRPGQTFALRGGWGNFDGSNAAGVTAAGAISQNVAVDAGVGWGANQGTVAGKAGVTIGW